MNKQLNPDVEFGEATFSTRQHKTAYENRKVTTSGLLFKHLEHPLL